MLNPKDYSLKRNTARDTSLFTKIGARTLEINFKPDQIGRVNLGPLFIPVAPLTMRNAPYQSPFIIFKVPITKCYMEKLTLVAYIPDYYGTFQWDLIGFHLLQNGNIAIPEEFPLAPQWINPIDYELRINSKVLTMSANDSWTIEAYNETPLTQIVMHLGIQMHFERDNR